MRMIPVLAAGLLAATSLTAAPAEAQYRHGWHGGYNRGWHGGDNRGWHGGYGYRGRYGYRGGYRWHRGHGWGGGYRHRVCYWRFGRRVCRW